MTSTRKNRPHAKELIKALLISTAFTGSVMLSAAPSWAQQQTVHSYNIPAQPLDAALTAFAQQSGLQLSMAPDVASGRGAAALSGSLSVEEGLAQLLAGSGLTYSFLGQSTLIISAPEDNAMVPMADGSIMLGVIDVTATLGNVGASWDGSAETVYSTPGSVSHISQETISRFPGTGAGDIFKSTPGVIAAANHNGSSVDVNIRGLQGQNRVKVAIDGTQQSTSTWRGYLGVDERVYLDPDLIGGVSIEKGPSSGALGAGAIGGVVAVSTLGVNDILEEGQVFGGRLKLGISDNAIEVAPPVTFDQRTYTSSLTDFKNGSVSGALALKTENFDLVMASAARKAGNYVAGGDGSATFKTATGIERQLSYTKPGEEVFNSSEETYSALLKATFRHFDEHTLQLGYVHFQSRFGESLGSLLTTQDNTYRQVNLATAATDTYTAQYRWTPDNDLINLRANLWMTNVDAVTRSVGPAFYLPPWLTPAMRPPADDARVSGTRTWGTDISNSSILAFGSVNATFDYGASYSVEKIAGQPYLSRMYANEIGVYMDPANGTREIGSAFAKARVDLTDWLQITGGLRYDAYRLTEDGKGIKLTGGQMTFPNRGGGRLNPSVGLTVKPLEGLQLFALYSEGSRPPSLRETIGSDSLLAPNPALQAEVAKNWEVGVNFSREGLLTPDDRAGLKFSYFDNNYDGYISRVTNPNIGPGLPFYSVANIHKARYTGIELAASYDAGFVFGDLALTHYTGFQFCLTAANCAQSSISNDYAVNQITPETYTTLTLGTRLFEDKLTMGTRIITAGKRMGPEPISFQQTNYWLPYTVVDGFASVALNDNVTLDLNIQNVFDKYYVDALDGWMPAPGRTITAGITGKF